MSQASSMTMATLVTRPVVLTAREDDDGSLLICGELLVRATSVVDKVALNLKPLLSSGESITLTASTAIAIICSGTDHRYNVCGTIYPMYVLECLVKKALTFEALQSFFYFCADFDDDISVSFQGGNQQPSAKVTLDASTIDAAISDVRNQLLEFRSLAPAAAASSSSTFAACLTARWLSLARALCVQLIDQEEGGVASIAKRLQKISDCSSTAVADDTESLSRERKVQAIRDDARLLLDIRIFLESEMYSRASEGSDDVPTPRDEMPVVSNINSRSRTRSRSTSSGSIVLHLLLAELLGYRPAYEKCCAQWQMALEQGSGDALLEKLHDAAATSPSEGRTIISLFAAHAKDSPPQRPGLASNPRLNLDQARDSSHGRMETHSSYSPSPLMLDADDVIPVIPVAHGSSTSREGLVTPEPTPAPRPHTPPMSVDSLQTLATPADTAIDSLLPLDTPSCEPRVDAAGDFFLLRTPRQSNYEPRIKDYSKTPPSGRLYDRDGHFIGKNSDVEWLQSANRFSHVAMHSLDFGSRSSGGGARGKSFLRKVTTGCDKANQSTTKFSTSASSSSSNLAIEASTAGAEAGRKKAVQRLVEARKKIEFEGVSRQSQSALKESRLKSVELRAEMARIGYGPAATTSSYSVQGSGSKHHSKSVSIFHRAKRVAGSDSSTIVAPRVDLLFQNGNNSNISIDSSCGAHSQEISTVARRRAADRIKQHRLRLRLSGERAQQAARAKEALKWRERDQKIALFLDRQIRGAPDVDLLPGRARESTIRRSPRPVNVEPWERHAPHSQGRSSAAGYCALRAVGLAPALDNHAGNHHTLSSSSSSGYSECDDYDELSSQDSSLRRNTRANQLIAQSPNYDASRRQQEAVEHRFNSSSSSSCSSSEDNEDIEEGGEGDAQFTDLVGSTPIQSNTNSRNSSNERSNPTPTPSSRAAKTQMLSPTSIAGLQSNPTTPFSKQQQLQLQQSHKIPSAPPAYITVTVTKAWGLPEGTVYTNPYVVIDWGHLGRAATSAVADTTAPLFGCSLKFRSPLVRRDKEDREEEEEALHVSSSGCHRGVVVVDGIKYVTVAPLMRAFAYNKVDGASDELLGEGEVDSSSALGSGAAVCSLTDMEGCFAGYVELEMRLVK